VSFRCVAGHHPRQVHALEGPSQGTAYRRSEREFASRFIPGVATPLENGVRVPEMSVLSAPIRVLHVDDEPEVLELTATFLRRADDRLAVETATSAPAGLDRLAGEEIDCVVSDYDMPEMDGLAFLEAVRERHGDVPFVLFTGKGSEQVASDAISAGVTDYLQKSTGTEQYEILANRVRNVVAGHRSRAVLDERTRRLETLISNLPGVVYRCRNEPDWPMEFVGGECEELTGYPADALEGGDVGWGEDITHPDDRDRVWAGVQWALDAGEPFEFTYRIVTADEEPRWAWERGRGVREDGDLVALEGFITDVTDRIRYEAELEEERDRVRALFENSRDAIVYCEDEGDGPVVRDVNPAFEETFGYPRDEVVGDYVDDVVEPPDPEAATAINRGVREGERVERTVRRKTADGYREFRLLSVPLQPGESGERSYAVYTDVDDR
jgi:PAS domain S-box-containing protein